MLRAPCGGKEVEKEKSGFALATPTAGADKKSTRRSCGAGNVGDVVATGKRAANPLATIMNRHAKRRGIGFQPLTFARDAPAAVSIVMG